jgi:hypothetical protein
MNEYVDWVTNWPLQSAAVQFAVLGTLGEVLSHWIRQKKPTLPCTPLQLVGKMVAWAILGLIIKYGFAGMKGFTRDLVDHQMIPGFMGRGVGWAFGVSLFTNLLFGPQMMFFHRLEDNLILGTRGFQGLSTAWWTLIWFWIPAHTVTFSLPRPYQIGLAAVWGVVLGLILGASKPKNTAPDRSGAAD